MIFRDIPNSIYYIYAPYRIFYEMSVYQKKPGSTANFSTNKSGTHIHISGIIQRLLNVNMANVNSE